ncbi:uncharacterized protein [Anabrus simplex]|uniref:uncharacterized protein n=1 Tax=Anabrus simplex TaxID=316456 RepID=UPI0035A3C259
MFVNMGPYDLVFRRIEHCEDEGTKELDYHTKLNKVSKTEYAYNGECKIPDNTLLSVSATVYKKMQSGSWGKNYEHRIDNACVELKKYFPEIFKMFTEEYLKVAAECPIPADTYTAENWVVYVNEFPMEELEYGEYKVESVLLRAEERIGCIQLFVDVEEKAAE